jgi:hypothetical protein
MAKYTFVEVRVVAFESGRSQHGQIEQSPASRSKVSPYAAPPPEPRSVAKYVAVTEAITNVTPGRSARTSEVRRRRSVSTSDIAEPDEVNDGAP